jgi:UDP-N-acetylglucosamine acyltransferase
MPPVESGQTLLQHARNFAPAATGFAGVRQRTLASWAQSREKRREMAWVHATAIVDPAAQLADSSRIGPYCVVGAGVELDADVELVSHVVITGRTRIGEGTRVFPFASLGAPAQVVAEPTALAELVIGRGNVIREHVTMNAGTSSGGGATRVGQLGLFMVGAHVAHDCLIGDQVVIANQVALGGHVAVGSRAIIGGGSMVHQHVRIGRDVMIGGMSAVDADVMPFALAFGNRATVRGVNLKGLRRRGHDRQQLRNVREAFEQLLGPGEATMGERLATLEQSAGSDELVREVIAFVRAVGKRPLCRAA